MSKPPNTLHTIYLPLLLVTAGLRCLLLLPEAGAQPVPHNVTPPAPYAVPVIQPDGTVLHLIARGNPWQHWSETTDGYTVVKNKTGSYEYARARDGVLLASGAQALNPDQRSLANQRTLLSLSKHERPALSPQQIQQLRQQLSPFRNARTQARAAVPSEGKINVLAICIDYPDLPATRSTDSFYNMFNGPSDKPSFRQFYLENSYGKLDMSVDVVGWVRAQNSYRSYGNTGGYAAAHDLVGEAIDGAENQGVDFSKYDNDNDGNVDGVIIIHAGPGAEEGGRNEYIWSHRWAINSRYYDQRNVSDYTVQPETRYGGTVGIGIFCHEFGHLLGLPDLYDTDLGDGKSHGIGEWGLMGTGGWLGEEAYPAGLSAWSKETLGWAEVEDITEQYGTYDLKAASQNNRFLRVETPNDDEYFLLENRQRQGVDRQLNGTGLAIWHVDRGRAYTYPARNFVNADGNHKGVDLEEADGRYDLDRYGNRGDEGDLFPGINGQDSFNHSSDPSTALYTPVGGSTESGVRLEDIKETDGLITFTYRKSGANVGEDCAEPATAAAGQNQSEPTTSWYEFIMPRDGGISLAYTGDAQVAVYTACDGPPLAESTTAHLTVGYLNRGQRVLIRWEFAEASPSPREWTLRVENSVADNDSLALVAIYQQTDGANWTKQNNWLTGPVASWEGVKIKDGRVTELRLEEAGLQSNVPAELYQLTALQHLTIREQGLRGQLGSELTQLTELRELFVEVPNLSVAFVDNLAQLTKLEKLTLASVAANQAIPTSIAQLKGLKELVLTNAGITGSLPETLGQCRALTRVDISQNQLRGSVPAGLFSLPNLTYLALNDNQLESLPTNVLASDQLRACYLQNNLLQGALPRDVRRSSTTPLTLALHDNRFAGSVPEAWTGITFDELTLHNNELTGAFPPIMMPQQLDISNNQFTLLPPLEKSTFSQEQSSVLVCHSNRLTFEDLLPNREYLACADCEDRYAPQADVRVNLDRNLKSGEGATVTLPLDDNVTGSRYVWYRQEEEVARTNDNTLTVSGFTAAQAGAYSLDVTNDALPGLVLRVVGISLNFQEKQLQTITLPTIPDKTFGDEPFTLDARSSAGLPLEYQKVTGPIAVADNKVTIQGAGEAVVKVTSAGNDTYAATEQQFTFTIAKAQPVIQVTPVSDKEFDNEPFRLNVTATNGLSVALTVEEGNVELDNRWVRIRGTGGVRIRATRAADQDYEAAEPVTIAFDVNPADQSLTFVPVADTTYVPDGVIPLETTLSSGLEAQYEVVTGAVDIVDGQAVMKGAGAVTVRASQPGDGNYRAAEPVVQSFVIAKAAQTIYLERINDKLTTDVPFALEASSSGDLPVDFRILRGNATVNDGQLTIGGAGEVVVEAYQAGDTNYEAAPPVLRSFLVQAANKQSQTITLVRVPDTVLVGETLTLDIAVSSNLPLEVQVAGPAVLSEGGLVFNREGEVTLQVSQPGNDEYNAAATFNKTITVLTRAPSAQPLSQALVYGPADRQYGDSVTVEATSGLPLVLEVVEGPAVVTEAGQVKMTGLGTVRVKTVQAGSDRYTAIDTVIAFTVAPAVQTIAFDTLVLNDSTFLLQATVPSGLPVTYSVAGEGELIGDTLRLLSSEPVVVTASQDGDEFHRAATPQSRTFEIETITAADDEPVADVLSIYPNPSPAVFRIDLAAHVTVATYRVVNLQGQQVQQGTLRLSDTALDLGQVATGTYVLYLETEHSNTQHRLLKQ